MKYILLFVLALLSFCAQSQNTTHPKRLAVYTNVGLNVINELNLNADWRYTDLITLGGGIGKVYSNKLLDPMPISPSQNNLPGTVYDGLAFRANAKFFTKFTGQSGYWCAQLLVKSIGYKRHGFTDMYKGEQDYDSFTRSENALVIGIELLHGHRWNVANERIIWDVFYGIGLRDRHRRYITHTSSHYESGSPYAKPDPPIGTFTVDQLLPTVHFGINFGVNALK